MQGRQLGPATEPGIGSPGFYIVSLCSVSPTDTSARQGCRHQRLSLAGKKPLRGSCASAQFTTTKGIDHEASSHSSRDRYGGRHRLAVRIRRIRRDAHARPHVWSARLQLCNDDGILRDAQPRTHGRWHVGDGYGHDDVARCLTPKSSDHFEKPANSGATTREELVEITNFVVRRSRGLPVRSLQDTLLPPDSSVQVEDAPKVSVLAGCR